MARARILFAAVVIGGFASVSTALAQLEDHLWVGGTGDQSWQVNSNWSTTANHPAHFPNDPGRVDTVPATIVNSEGANLSVNLAANLNVDVGATDVTVASLTIGSTSGGVATNITSTGGRLVFENFEVNNTTPEPDVCAFNCDRARITSQGVALATNTITAVVGANDHIDVVGTKNITLAGGIQEMSNVEGTRAASLRAITPGLTVFVTGPVTTLSIDTSPNAGTQDTSFVFNSGPDGPASGALISQGTIDISGVISGSGIVQFNTQNIPAVVLPTVILRANNTHSGLNILGRGTIVLDNNSAFGTGALRQDGASSPIGHTGWDIESTADNRTIANEMRMGQWQTIKGNNSITFSGRTYQTNTAGWINMMPATETLTLSGPQYVFHIEGLEGDETIHRIYTFDGSGKTEVTGGIHGRWDEETQSEVIEIIYPSSIAKQGTGAVYINGPASNFNESVIVHGGNLHFANEDDYNSAEYFTSEAGAVGVDSGFASNPNFLAKLNNSQSIPSVVEFPTDTVYDRGGLMLASGEYDDAINFNGAFATAADMSIAAHEAGSPCATCTVYSGVVTPSTTSTFFSPANTYRFGGGSGTLTLPGLGATGGPYTANQLTGARDLLITNGGEVKITNTNDYTGKTSIIAEFVNSLEKAANENTIFFNDGDLVPNGRTYLGTTLTVTSLSSIGSSSNAASNLYIQGSTLKYEGAATSTNRLFTIGTGGATIDASGTGAVNFTNTASLGVDVAESRTTYMNPFYPGIANGESKTTLYNISHTEDLQHGMPIFGPTFQFDTRIAQIIDPHTIRVDKEFNEFEIHNANNPPPATLFFGAAPERKLTLTGANTENNTLASIIPNASDGGVVGLTKNGGGKWIVTAANTYTGTTTVNAGTLLVNNTGGSGTGTGAVTVNSTGTLGGTGAIAGAVTVNSGGHIAPGASIESLNVGGSLTFAAGSFLDFELGAPGASDLINSTLDGGLNIAGGTVNLINAGGLAAGTYTLIDYAGVLTGNESNLVFGTVPAGFTYDLIDTGSVINLSVIAAPTNDADFNNDGIVNSADYAVWRKFNGGSGTPQTGDANGDTNVNSTDYGIWRNTFGNSVPGGGGGGSVPEPSSFVLVGIAALCTLGRKRCRR